MRHDETTTANKPKRPKKKPVETAPIERLGYSIEECAASIGISRPTIYRMIKDGKGPKITDVRGRRIVKDVDRREWVNKLGEASA
jgi:excisionase family DNA binding protein